MRFPVNKPYTITQGFSTKHPAIDIAPIPAGKKGVKCLAPEKGRIVTVGFNPALEGRYIIMKGKKMYYYFGHFEKWLVRAGEKVKEGQAIGILGSTGLSTGIHTHNEVRPQPGPTNQIDPLKWYKEKDMYKGKTAKQLWKEAKAWKTKAQARAKKLKILSGLVSKIKSLLKG